MHLAAFDQRTRARVGEINAALRIDDQVIGLQHRVGAVAARDLGDLAVLAEAADAQTGRLDAKQVAVAVVSKPVGLAGLLVDDRDVALRIEPVHARRAQIDKIKAAVGHRQRAFSERKALAHEFELRIRREHARDTALR